MVGRFIVYCATSPSGRRYVGCTGRGLAERKRGHLAAARKGVESKFYRAVRKYGFDAFEWVVLARCSDVSEMHEQERRLIAHFESQRIGYNVTSGGEGAPGRRNTPEQSAAHGARQRVRFERVAERATVADGVRAWIRGNEEAHRAASERRAASLRSADARARAAATQRAFLSENPERAAEISEARAASVRRAATKISASLGGRPIEVFREGSLVAVFPTQHECSRVLGVGLGCLQHCLRGTRKRSKGYEFRYSGGGNSAAAEAARRADEPVAGCPATSLSRRTD